MFDYTIFYKNELPLNGPWPMGWDVLISGYLPVDRITHVFNIAVAPSKWWLLFPEYAFTANERPSGQVFDEIAGDESEYVSKFYKRLLPQIGGGRVCVDMTGFVRPYLMCLIRTLAQNGVRSFDVLYTEPIQYDERENTTFSGGIVDKVRQVIGFEGPHYPEDSDDLLVIGSGYEDKLIGHVAEDKLKARKLQVIGFPSLRADMYQENILSICRADESISSALSDEWRSFFAPANDPFVAASVLSEIVEERKWKSKKKNLYLCPLSTKAHVLGFTIFYLTECQNEAASIIFPFEQQYSRNTSKGVARIWKYSVELPPVV